MLPFDIRKYHFSRNIIYCLRFNRSECDTPALSALNGGYCRPLGYYSYASMAASGTHSSTKAASSAALLSSFDPCYAILSTTIV